MSDYISILENSLGKAFSIDNYCNFIVNFLNGTELKEISQSRSAEFFAEYNYYIQNYTFVAEYIDPQRKKVGVYAIKLKKGRDIEKARSKQRNFVAKLLSDNNFDAAIAAFYTDYDTKWRLSFVRLDYEFIKGKVAQSLTPAKRYSYLVGEGEPCHTAKESLLPIFANENFAPTIDSIESAFSVEKVTKQFFEIYREKYIELKEYLESISCFNDEAKRKGFTSEQYAKKFMGQLVFLYFLQKKGWLGVKALPAEITESEYKKLFFANSITRAIAPSIYPKVEENLHKLNASAVFDLSQKEEEKVAKIIKGNPWGTGSRRFVRDLFEIANNKQFNFFDEYLEPLFYDGLNKKRDADNYYTRLHCRIPFLNGGLFEPLDNYDWENNFFSIPNEIFSNKAIKGERDADGILDIFDRYNFTMNEDEPLEKEVAVDPEMLGKIFENLLDVKDRKSKGAFYTPREIVHYMCQESLTNYLVNTVNVPYEDAHDFVLYGEIMKDEDCSRERRDGLLDMLMPISIYEKLNEIDIALADVRVADPAVGSGAFPMGMLSEIVKLREIITEYFARDLDKLPEFVDWYKDKKVASQLNAVRWKLRNENRNSYVLKKETMRNSIYAVDIEPSAVDITKLRLWLTLVVEQEIDVNDPFNDSPIALPNLDCNIMCGNSLIDEFEGVDLSFDSILFGDEGQSTLWTSSIDIDLEKLFVLQREFFYADSHDKKEDLRQKIIDAKEKLINIAFDGASTDSKVRFATANSLHSTPFFLWKLNFAKVFKDKGGFDIVIGNPPYFNVQTLGAKNSFISQLMTLYSEIWMDKSDILFYFMYLGHKLSAKQVCYITSNAYLFSDKAKRLRNFIVSKFPIKQIINFERFMVFDTASITSCITLLEGKNQPNRSISCRAKVMKNSEYNLSEFLHNDKLFFDVTLSKDDYFSLIPQRIKKLDIKIKSNYPQLGTILKVGKGMETAANEVFLFNEKPNFPDAFLRKRITGEMISKYEIADATQYLLYYEDIEEWGALDERIQKHLLSNKSFLESRATVKNEGRVWWKYSRPMHRSFYHFDKIWCSYRGTHNCFALDVTGEYIGFTNTTVVFASNPEYNIKYILALLNSSLLEYQHRNNNKQTGGGVYEYFPNSIEKYPIPVISLEKQQEFVDLVDKILDLKKNNAEANIEKDLYKINKLTYSLYQLTLDEIAIVEGKVYILFENNGYKIMRIDSFGTYSVVDINNNGYSYDDYITDRKMVNDANRLIADLLSQNVLYDEINNRKCNTVLDMRTYEWEELLDGLFTNIKGITGVRKPTNQEIAFMESVNKPLA